MEQGAYKLPSGDEVRNYGVGGVGVNSSAPVGYRNNIGNEIKHLIDEIDIGNTQGAGARQNSNGLHVSNVTSSLVPKNIQGARHVDQMYLQEIENKLGLLNNMMTINKNWFKVKADGHLKLF